MSSFRVKETEMTSKDALMAACEQQYGKRPEWHETPAKLNGWGTQHANVVLRRGTVKGCSYDTGFRLENGKFVAVAADHDMRALQLEKLNQAYNEQHTLASASAKGLKFVRKERIQDPENKAKWITRLRFQPV
jgi:hypothetical protein